MLDNFLVLFDYYSSKEIANLYPNPNKRVEILDKSVLAELKISGIQTDKEIITKTENALKEYVFPPDSQASEKAQEIFATAFEKYYAAPRIERKECQWVEAQDLDVPTEKLIQSYRNRHLKEQASRLEEKKNSQKKQKTSADIKTPVSGNSLPASFLTPESGSETETLA